MAVEQPKVSKANYFSSSPTPKDLFTISEYTSQNGIREINRMAHLHFYFSQNVGKSLDEKYNFPFVVCVPVYIVF